MNDTIARALQNVCPFVEDAGVLAAFGALENISTALSDHTKLSLICRAATRQYGKGTKEACGVVRELLTAIRAALCYKDITKENDLTKEHLTGARSKAGLCHVFFKRVSLIEFINCLVSSWPMSPHALEALSKILPKLILFSSYVAFADDAPNAAVDATNSAASSVGDGDGNRAPEVEYTGISSATAKNLDDFMKELAQVENCS